VDGITDYTGHGYDTVLNKYFAQYRMYDAENKRFMAVDPIKDGLNWYSYVDNSPTNFFDPLGQEGTALYQNITGYSKAIELLQRRLNHTGWSSKYYREVEGVNNKYLPPTGNFFEETLKVVNYYKDNRYEGAIQNDTTDTKGKVGKTTWEFLGLPGWLLIPDSNPFWDKVKSIEGLYAYMFLGGSKEDAYKAETPPAPTPSNGYEFRPYSHFYGNLPEVSNPSPKGEVMFFQHGINAGVDTFGSKEGIVALLKEDSKFISAGYISTRNIDGSVQIKVNDDFVSSGIEKLGLSRTEEIYFKSLPLNDKIIYLTNNGINVMWRTEFSNPQGSHFQQVCELEKMINSVVSNELLVTLIGHSKGGLVSIEYSNRNPNKVDKLITLDTPYLGNLYAQTVIDRADELNQVYLDALKKHEELNSIGFPNIFEKTARDNAKKARDDAWQDLASYISVVSLGKHLLNGDISVLEGYRDLAGDNYNTARTNIRDAWNSRSNAPNLYALSVDTLGLKGDALKGDIIVSFESQQGGDFKRTIPLTINTSGEFWWHGNATKNSNAAATIKKIILQQ